MSNCVIKVCRNYKGRSKTTHNVTYHRIPSDPIMRSRWIEIIRRSRSEELWKPSKYSVICSDHFNKNEMYFVNNEGRRRLKKTAVPCKALFLSSVQSDESDIATDEEIHKTFITFNAGSSGISKLEYVSSIETKNTSDTPEITHNNTLNHTDVETEDHEEFSDLDPLFDTPKEAKLRRDLRRKTILQRKHILKIQSLRRKIIRLKKKITNFKEIIENFKKEK